MPLIITITCVSILVCILCCIRCNPLVYEFIKRRCTKKISIAEKKELPQHTVKLNIKEKAQKKVTPLKNYIFVSLCKQRGSQVIRHRLT